jgi:DNA-nicking Smr family endonuclease
MSAKRSGPDGIKPDDRALWDAVKKSVKPLRNAKPRAPKLATAPEKSETPPSAARTKSQKLPKPPAAQPAKPSAPKPPPLASLDRRTRSRVARGRVEIDARLDLHGLTLERARSRLANFLASAQSRGAGLVLVITGKGGTGALRREAPFWLSSPELRSLVIGFEEAAQSHGGAGALYVRVRRQRKA